MLVLVTLNDVSEHLFWTLEQVLQPYLLALRKNWVLSQSIHKNSITNC